MDFDLVILDEAQRIKNWKTKTSQHVKDIPSRYAIVLTGTPLENRPLRTKSMSCIPLKQFMNSVAKAIELVGQR